MKKQIPSSSRRTRGGFTLHELMISMVIAVFILSAMMLSFVQHNYVFNSQRLKIETLQNSRTSLDQMSRDIRTAGYGLATRHWELKDWVTWIPNIESNPHVIQGEGSAPDEVHIVAAFDQPVARLNTPCPAGATIIPMDLGISENDDDDDDDHAPTSSSLGNLEHPFDLEKHFLVYIGKMELARIVGFSSSGLIISTDPTSMQGLRLAYEPGTPIELIKTVRYSIETFEDRPYLSRDDSTATYAHETSRMCAGNIEDLQVTRNRDAIEISVEARSMRLDTRHLDREHKDHYRRHQLVSRVASRNNHTSNRSIPRTEVVPINPQPVYVYAEEN